MAAIIAFVVIIANAATALRLLTYRRGRRGTGCGRVAPPTC